MNDISEPWEGGILRAIHDRCTKRLAYYALEDEAGTLWSGAGPQEEIDLRLSAGEEPLPPSRDK